MTEAPAHLPPPPAAPGPPFGYYPDPSGAAQWRWWSGRQWGDQTLDRRGGNRNALQRAVEREATMAKALLDWICTTVAIAAAFRALVEFATVPDQLRLARWAHRVMAASLHGQSNLTAALQREPTTTTTGALHLAQVLANTSTFITLAGAVVFLRFLRRAVGTASIVGYPARYSVRGATIAWFVPFVNLVVPNLALADCLAPADPRRRATRALLVASLAVLLVPATELLSFASPSRATCAIASIVTAAATVAWAVTAHRAVAAVHHDHANVAELLR
jgi:hypothetical protein